MQPSLTVHRANQRTLTDGKVRGDLTMERATTYDSVCIRA